MGFRALVAGVAGLLLTLSLIQLTSCDYGFHTSRGRNISHNLIIGRHNYGDRLLYHNVVNVSGRPYRFDRDVRYPAHGYSYSNISYIRVIDSKTDGTGGYPQIIQGGIGRKNVTIRLTSQRYHGLHFNITIYGR